MPPLTVFSSWSVSSRVLLVAELFVLVVMVISLIVMPRSVGRAGRVRCLSLESVAGFVIKITLGGQPPTRLGEGRWCAFDLRAVSPTDTAENES